MKTCKVSNACGIIAGHVRIADHFFSRFIGLQGRKALAEGEGLLIRPCRQIHTFFMRFTLDVLFVSKEGVVVHIIEYFGKNLISPEIRLGREVIELQGGTVSKKHIHIGDTILFEDR